MVAQLLASEGFASVEDIAFVERDEIAAIEGFDEGDGGELQARARDYLEKIEADRTRSARSSACPTISRRCPASPPR